MFEGEIEKHLISQSSILKECRKHRASLLSPLGYVL